MHRRPRQILSYSDVCWQLRGKHECQQTPALRLFRDAIIPPSECESECEPRALLQDGSSALHLLAKSIHPTELPAVQTLIWAGCPLDAQDSVTPKSPSIPMLVTVMLMLIYALTCKVLSRMVIETFDYYHDLKSMVIVGLLCFIALCRASALLSTMQHRTRAPRSWRL